ncbi:MAG: hypothetical protein ACREQ5_12015, partial [Candidatus Dormibacteria bacterium]
MQVTVENPRQRYESNPSPPSILDRGSSATNHSQALTNARISAGSTVAINDLRRVTYRVAMQNTSCGRAKGALAYLTGSSHINAGIE